jgi:iron complex outermembrane receptor protein
MSTSTARAVGASVLLGVVLLWSGIAHAQETTLRIVVVVEGGPAVGAIVLIDETPHSLDMDGAVVAVVAAGEHRVRASLTGFLTADVRVNATPGQQTEVPLELLLEAFEEQVLVVASTRTGRRIEDQPMHVEVLGREEIEEKMMMTPGDIVMMLNELGGLRVQSTSPAMGSASLRIQGMRGRYTRFFSDGLPLFGDQPSGIGLLQIPPMDLGQVEVIKGVASALYGAGAMGGVVNLVARRPRNVAAHEVLLNQSTRGATDGVAWLSTPLGERTGASLLAGLHRQIEQDVDGDGWADLAAYDRFVARPRFYWNGTEGDSLFATAGVTREDREGGTVAGAVLAPTGEAYLESIATTRVDVGIVGQKLIDDRLVLTARGAAVGQWHDHRFGESRERDNHATVYGEMALRGAAGRHTWVVGTALELDRYRSEDVPRFDYSFVEPGLFVQDDVEIANWLAVSAGARLDWHSEYGTFLSPRVSTLVRLGGFTSRASFGTGFFGPTPLTEETEAAGLTRLQVQEPLVAERGRGFAVDVAYAVGAFASTVTYFRSRIENPVIVEREARYLLRNLDGTSENEGAEVLLTMRRAPFVLTASYTYVDAEDIEQGTRRDVPLTPRHSGGMVAMVESEEQGRVGVELYYTGRQSLESDPYRSTSEPYWILGILAEKRFGSWSLFINGENLTNVRQSNYGSILLSERAVDGRWTVDAWAPLEGRVVNGGVRLRF